MSAAFWPVVITGAFLVWIFLVTVDLDVPAFLSKWYRAPGNSVRAMTWIGSLLIVLITLSSPVDSLLASLRTDSITVAVTVIIIEELGRYRASLEEKERIIRQMGSHSNDFALEAVRIIREAGWYEDGSLRKRNFVQANLQGVVLESANIAGVDLEKANLQGANLQGANLHGANLVWANLQDADLFGADLREAIISPANLQGANLPATDMRRAILFVANLQGAWLVGAKLQGAGLQLANLSEAGLQYANLSETNLSETILTGAKYSKETIWPNGFDPKEAGAILVDWDEEKHEWVPIENVSQQTIAV